MKKILFIVSLLLIPTLVYAVPKGGAGSDNGEAALISYVDRGDPAAADLTQAGMTTDGTWNDWDLSSIVPAGAKAVVVYAIIQDDATGKFVYLRENGNSNEFNVSTIGTQVSTVYISSCLIVSCDSNRVIEYKTDNNTFTAILLTVKGWYI